MTNSTSHQPQSLNVTHVYPFFHKKGGVERYLCELSTALSGLNCSQTIVCAKNDPQEAAKPTVSPVRFFQIPAILWPKFLVSFSFAIIATLRINRKNAGIINSQGANLFRQDIITIQSCHKTWFKLSLGMLEPYSKSWWLKILNPIHYLTIMVETIQLRPGNYRRIIAISRNVKADIMEAYGVPADDIEVIHSGVNCHEFTPATREGQRGPMRAKLGISDQEIAWVFVANEFKRKGLSTILAALRLINDKRIKLVVVGNDSRNAIKQANVIYCGPTNDVASYFAMADGFVFPTVYEAFGLVILEAMASGLPVITSRIAGAAELIDHGRNGFLLDHPTDPKELKKYMYLLSRDEAMRRRVGENARQTALSNTWHHVAEKTLTLYQNVLVLRN